MAVSLQYFSINDSFVCFLRIFALAAYGHIDALQSQKTFVVFWSGRCRRVARFVHSYMLCVYFICVRSNNNNSKSNSNI